eukprot:m.338298 g.338298  ORF g.338298 m.338298 type:complete len:142 (-) comp18376_c0_seq1:159-584(-)
MDIAPNSPPLPKETNAQSQTNSWTVRPTTETQVNSSTRCGTVYCSPQTTPLMNSWRLTVTAITQVPDSQPRFEDTMSHPIVTLRNAIPVNVTTVTQVVDTPSWLEEVYCPPQTMTFSENAWPDWHPFDVVMSNSSDSSKKQ